MSHRICTGIGRRKLGKLIEELAPLWLAQQESRLRARRGRDRLRAEGAGPDRELPFADRVIATLVVLRFQLPHTALAVFYGVHRSTITRAVGEIRPLLAARGFAVHAPEAPSAVLGAESDDEDAKFVGYRWPPWRGRLGPLLLHQPLVPGEQGAW